MDGRRFIWHVGRVIQKSYHFSSKSLKIKWTQNLRMEEAPYTRLLFMAI